jgi:hypothetical protein
VLLARALGDATPVVWDDPAVDWDAFDLVVIRSTWDYTGRRNAYVEWVESLGDLVLNPPDVIRWNTDKRYLADLAAAGLPVVPTGFVAPGEQPEEIPSHSVVKPAVSAGSQDTARHEDRAAAEAHLRRLTEAGRVAMVQPYLEEIDEAGETALLYCEGRYSHAIRKGPLLLGGAATVEGLFAPENITPREPRAIEREVGDAVMAEAQRRFGGPLLYGRVDLIGEQPVVLELELTEPSLFFAHDEGAPARFAEAIRRRVAAAESA